MTGVMLLDGAEMNLSYFFLTAMKMIIKVSLKRSTRNAMSVNMITSSSA